MKKIIRLTEADLTRIVKKVIKEQSLSKSSYTPSEVEQIFLKMPDSGFWTNLEEYKKIYNFLSQFDGKRVKGISKCFPQFKNIDKTVLQYLDFVESYQGSAQCSEIQKAMPQVSGLAYSLLNVGTMTLGKEGDLIKNKFKELFNKNGVTGDVTPDF
jgi:hypothetical protein